MQNLPPNSATLPDLLRKLAAIVVTVAIIGVALMFSVVLIAVILLAGLLGWGYLMWKTRHLRKMMSEVQARNAAAMQRGAEHAADAEIIEGEVVQVYESRIVK
jgi:uncharacterized membrane protein YdbT with pleckstrin-like domain